MFKRILILLFVAAVSVSATVGSVSAQAPGSSEIADAELRSLTQLTTEFIMPVHSNIMRAMAYAEVDPQKSCDAAKVAKDKAQGALGFYENEKKRLETLNQPTTTMDMLGEVVIKMNEVVPKVEALYCSPSNISAKVASEEAKARLPVYLHMADAMDNIALGLKAEINNDQKTACESYMKANQDIETSSTSFEQGKSAFVNDADKLSNLIADYRAKIQSKLVGCKAA